jgi:hypothetical protein
MLCLPCSAPLPWRLSVHPALPRAVFSSSRSFNSYSPPTVTELIPTSNIQR